jgi:hypothetical protein
VYRRRNHVRLSQSVARVGGERPTEPRGRCAAWVGVNPTAGTSPADRIRGEVAIIPPLTSDCWPVAGLDSLRSYQLGRLLELDASVAQTSRLILEHHTGFGEVPERTDLGAS